MRRSLNLSRIAASLLLLAATSHAAVDFTVAPYLRLLEKESVIVSFELNQKSSGELRYGTDPDRLDQTVRFTEGDFHAIQLRNLTPETVYHYAVQVDDPSGITNPERQFFKTPAEQPKPFTFAVYGDTSSGVESYDLNHSWVLRSIMEDTFPEFAVITGDIVDNGTKPDNWRRFFYLERDLLKNIPIYAVMGNTCSMGPDLFKKYFTYGDQQTHYSFDRNGCHFIVLNILRGQGNAYYNSFRPGNPQFTWLLSDLQSENNKLAKFTFVFFHAPVFSPDGRGNILIREMLHPLFKKYGVDMAFNGTHCYSRAEKDGIVYYITGGGGAELRETKSRKIPEIKEDANLFHHLRIHVDHPVVMTDVVDLQGSVFSSHTYWDPEVNKSTEEDSGTALNGEAPQQLIATASQATNAVPVSVFSLPSCGYCQDLMDKIIPRMAENLGVNIPITYYSLSDAANFEKLIQLEYQLNDKDNELPAVIIGNRLLGGKTEINKELQKTVLLYSSQNLSGESVADIDTQGAIKEKFESFKILPVILAGLLDGINPCAFTTILFLLSYLVYLGKSKKEVLTAGISFSAGVFLTYMIIGLGFSELLSSIQVHGRMSEIVKYITFLLVLVLGLLNLRDCIKIKQGKTDEISLKLSKSTRRKIQDKVKVQSQKSGLITGSFILGFFVSTFELACTGQMYVPTLIYMLRISEARLKAVAYLILYNLMFILPLILVFLAVYFGLAKESVIRRFRDNLFAIKLLTALLFLGLAIFILII